MAESPITTEELDEMLNNMYDVMRALQVYAETQMANIIQMKDLNEKAKGHGDPE